MLLEYLWQNCTDLSVSFMYVQISVKKVLYITLSFSSKHHCLALLSAMYCKSNVFVIKLMLHQSAKTFIAICPAGKYFRTFICPHY